MTDIPNDVVERAKQIIASYNCAGNCPQTVDDCTCRLTARAAGRVFVEWEREEAAKVVDEYGDLPGRAAAAKIRARSKSD